MRCDEREIWKNLEWKKLEWKVKPQEETNTNGIESNPLSRQERIKKLKSRFLLLTSTQAKRENINWDTVKRIKKGEEIDFREKTLKKYGI